MKYLAFDFILVLATLLLVPLCVALFGPAGAVLAVAIVAAFAVNMKGRRPKLPAVRFAQRRPFRNVPPSIAV